MNYRLGVLGFFNLGQLKTGNALDDSGNFALLDIIKSLQFVNRNIAAFGGDPGNVTLMGQSAGAVNVFAVMTSPLVVNANPALVHKLLPISGGISPASELPAGSIATLAPRIGLPRPGRLPARADGDRRRPGGRRRRGDRATSRRSPRREIADLHARQERRCDLATVITKLAPIGAGGSGPIPDGNVLPANPIAAIRAGQLREGADARRQHARRRQAVPDLLPLVGGAARPAAERRRRCSRRRSTTTRKRRRTTTVEQWIPASYLPATTPGSGFNAKTEQLNRMFFLASRDSMLSALKTQQSNIWYYRFDWDELPAPFNVIYGAAHAFDLPFAFGNFGPRSTRTSRTRGATRPAGWRCRTR